MSSVNTYKFLFHFVLSLHLINIALQFVFKMSAFGFNASLKARPPLVNGSIGDQVIKLLPGMNDSLTQFFNVSDLCSVNFILYYSLNFVINRIYVRAVWRPKIRRYEFRRYEISLLFQQFNSLPSSVSRNAILLKCEIV